MMPCKECSAESPVISVYHDYWWDCPKLHDKPFSYNWHFAQGQNDARREDFFKRKAADPFGGDE